MAWGPSLAKHFAEDMADEMQGWANDMMREIYILRGISDRDCASPEVYLAFWRGVGFSLPDGCLSEFLAAIRDGDIDLYEELWQERRDLDAARDAAAIEVVQARMEKRRSERGPRLDEEPAAADSPPAPATPTAEDVYIPDGTADLFRVMIAAMFDLHRDRLSVELLEAPNGERIVVRLDGRPLDAARAATVRNFLAKAASPVGLARETPC